MSYKIKTGRVKGEKPIGTFGKAKKSFKAKNRNHKGSVLKNIVKTYKHEPLNADRPIRFPEVKYKKRQKNIRSLGACQVCDMRYTLDAPHHVEQGSKKDDRYLINICIDCHGLIHTVGYSGVKKDRVECKIIAWSNHILFEEEEL